MSGLLVKCTLIMRDNLEELNDRSLTRHPGPARRRRPHPHLCRADLREVYDGSPVLRQGRLRGPTRHGPARRAQARRRRRSRLGSRAQRERRAGPHGITDSRRRPRRRARPLPRGGHATTRCSTPPFLGSKVVKGIALDEIAAVHQRDRAVPQPVAVPAREGATAARTTTSSRTGSGRSCASSWPRPRPDLLVPQVVYGYFPANGDGNDLVIWTDESRTTERPLPLPPPERAPFLCIADFFRPVDWRGRLRRLPHRHDGRACRTRRPSSSPPTSTRSTC